MFDLEVFFFTYFSGASASKTIPCHCFFNSSFVNFIIFLLFFIKYKFFSFFTWNKIWDSFSFCSSATKESSKLSKLSKERVAKVEDVVKVWEMVDYKVLSVDKESGKIGLERVVKVV